MSLRLTVEPRDSDHFQQDYSDDCRACGILFKQFHHKCSSLTKEVRDREEKTVRLFLCKRLYFTKSKIMTGDFVVRLGLGRDTCWSLPNDNKR